MSLLNKESLRLIKTSLLLGFIISFTPLFIFFNNHSPSLSKLSYTIGGHEAKYNYIHEINLYYTPNIFCSAILIFLVSYLLSLGFLFIYKEAEQKNLLNKNYFMGLLGIGLMLLALVSITKNPILFMDSQSYLNISLKVQSMNLVHLSNTPSFPFLLAIFYSDLSVIVFFQTIFSVLAWTFLGVVLASLLNSKFLKSLVVLIFILFPFTNLIWPWDYNILTESLNLSTYAVILGLIINLTKRYLNPLNFNIPLNYKDHILSLIAVFLIGTLFSFTRDANMIIDQIFVFYFIGIALILFFLRKITKKIKIVHFLFPAIIAIIFGGIYFLHSFDLKKSPRSLVPITHGLFSIFQENTEYKQFFIDRGMPIEPFLLDLENPSAEITWENFQKNQDYQKWIKNDALNEYKLFLLKHPFFVFERLKKELPYLINPLGSYGYRFSPLEIKMQNISNQILVGWLFKLRLLFLFGFLIISLFYLNFVQKYIQQKDDFSLRNLVLSTTIILLMIISFSQFFVAIFGDIGAEIERHSLLGRVNFWLGSIMIFFFFLDKLVSSLHPKLANFRQFPVLKNIFLWKKRIIHSFYSN